MAKLLIKYQDSYICERNLHEIDYISVPSYYPNNEDFSNISIFITLLLSNNLTKNYLSKINLNEIEWKELFETYFLPECLKQVGKETYIYDLDELINDYPKLKVYYDKLISNLELPLVIKMHSELKNSNEEIESSEEARYNFEYPVVTVNKDLEVFISKRHRKRNDKDCLLLYSGGRDSTLAAVRLFNEGYNVHFIHLDNGHMLDQNKPYLTFEEMFDKEERFYFDYELSSVDIRKLFEEYFDNNLTIDNELLSEIRCLSCRVAMYTKVIQIAKERGYKYIAEGARISQKFMLEQLPIIDRLKELVSSQGMTLLLPVLYIEDDKLEIEELLSNGYSSKTWESKCLIGKPAKDKTEEDERIIINYYDEVLEPVVQKKLEYKKETR